MSNSAYIDAVFSAWSSPDRWDAGGIPLTGAEQAFKEFGALVEKSRSGALSAAEAGRMDTVAKYFSTSMSKIATAVSAINIPAVTPDELKLKAFIASFSQQGQQLVQGTGLLLDEIAAGSATAAQRLSQNAALLLKFGGGILAITQVSMAYTFDGACIEWYGRCAIRRLGRWTRGRACCKYWSRRFRPSSSSRFYFGCRYSRLPRRKNL
jgi:hypothetical protein